MSNLFCKIPSRWFQPVEIKKKMERVMGLEPTTFCMASRCSTN